MFGDLSPFVGMRLRPSQAPPPSAPIPLFTGLGPDGQLAAVPGGFKVADNQSAAPQDRLFTSFNYFDDLFAAYNRRLGNGIRDQRVYREVFGLEKTFFGQRSSIGLQVPLNTYSFATSSGRTRSSTALGDLTAFAKYVLLRDPSTGSLLSSGLAVTAPSGPSAFAGFEGVRGFHTTSLQPFLGYIVNRNNWYLQGFLAIDVPADNRDVTVLYNDVGVGYFLYHRPDTRHLITALAPTLEAHVNNPLNHRGFQTAEGFGAPDSADLTYGLHIQSFGRAWLSLALATPVTGPKLFDYEFIALLNVQFGPSAGRVDRSMDRPPSL
jgi:hypothetical protein